MALSGQTSTLPHLVVQGHDFEGHSLACRFGPTSTVRGFINHGHDNIIIIALLARLSVGWRVTTTMSLSSRFVSVLVHN